jgi:hypothetical protein
MMWHLPVSVDMGEGERERAGGRKTLSTIVLIVHTVMNIYN